jgi:hypothetical protein
MNVVARLFVVAVAFGISACASVPMAPAQFDISAKAFTPPPPDRAHVYVYRNESMGAGVKMDLMLDGQQAGTTVAKTFALLPVRPGQHKLTSEAENTSELILAARPGEILFVWQEVKMGVLYARNKLQLVAPQVGTQGVLECNLIGAPPPPLAPPVFAPPPQPPPPPAPVPVPPPPPPPARP